MTDNTPCIKFFSGRMFNPFLNRMLHWGWRFGIQYIPWWLSPSPLLQPSFHLYIPADALKAWGCNFWILSPVFQYLSAFVALLQFVALPGGWLEAPTTSSHFPFKGVHGYSCAKCPHLDSEHYLFFLCHLVHCLTVDVCWLLYSGASVLPLSAAQSAHSTSQYHLSHLPELISHNLWSSSSDSAFWAAAISWR